MNSDDPISPDDLSETVLDTFHNDTSLPYRIVSSDGVLYCVSKKALIQSDVLWHMVESATGDAIRLTDRRLEDEYVVTTVLDILVGNFTTISPAHACYALLFSDKYGIDMVVAFCRNLLLHQLKEKKIQDIVVMFQIYYVAAIQDQESLASEAVEAMVLSKGSVSTLLPHEALQAVPFGNIPTAYAWALTQTLASKETPSMPASELFLLRLATIKDLLENFHTN